MYEYAYRLVATRSFGYLGPTTMMIPFADCINHQNHDAEYDSYHHGLQNKPIHELTKEEKPYFNEVKFVLDYDDYTK